MKPSEDRSLLQLFEQILPDEQWEQLAGGEDRGQIYTLPVVVEMMLLQRLQERGTQQAAVHQVVAGKLGRFLRAGKRVREGRISCGTGAYAQACQRLGKAVLEQVCDVLLNELRKRIAADAELRSPLLLADGTTLSVEHVPELLQDFPAGHNQHGEGHWGVVQLVAFHDVETGIALRPAWGAMYGPEAVSEQQLFEQILQQAPPNGVILGDRNFGVFSVADAAQQRGHRVVIRLTKARAESLGARGWRSPQEQTIRWQPTRQDRARHRSLSADAQVQGRLIMVQQKGFREALYLFTTLEEPWEKVVALYAKRWQMELDLRTIKRTLRLHHLRGKSRATVEKELLIAVVAYGLVRACMALAAQRAKLPPRRLSFTRCYGLLDAMIAGLCSPLSQQRSQSFERILAYMAQSKLPHRTQPRSYPRMVWGFRQAFPRRRPLPGKQIK